MLRFVSTHHRREKKYISEVLWRKNAIQQHVFSLKEDIEVKRLNQRSPDTLDRTYLQMSTFTHTAMSISHVTTSSFKNMGQRGRKSNIHTMLYCICTEFTAIHQTFVQTHNTKSFHQGASYIKQDKGSKISSKSQVNPIHKILDQSKHTQSHFHSVTHM